MANGKRSNGEGQILYDKRRKTYRARVTVGWEMDIENGKMKQIVKSLGSFKTKGEAASALSDYLRNPYDINNRDITFSQLFEKWLEDFLPDHISHKYRIKSAYKYCSSLYNKKFRDISIYDLKKCINTGTALCIKGKYKGQERPATPSVKESMKYIFNHMYEYALEARLVERNYAKDFTLDKKIFVEKEKNRIIRKPFSQEEIDKLWRSVDFVPFTDMIIYACYSGWRPTELCTLLIEDVDLDNDVIIGGIKTEAGKRRIVPIHPLVKDIVIKYYNDALKLNSKYLFNDSSKKKGIGLSYDQYLTRFNNAMNQLNFDSVLTPHCTRHTFATRAKMAGVNEYILKIILGHEIKDITESVYTHRDIEELKTEIQKIK